MHTPGPWNRIIGREGDGSPRSHEHQIYNDQGTAVCIVQHDGSPEAEENDRIILAAPDLLAVCKEADRRLRRRLVHMSPRGDDLVDKLSAAIAKAEGGAA